MDRFEHPFDLVKLSFGDGKRNDLFVSALGLARLGRKVAKVKATFECCNVIVRDRKLCPDEIGLFDVIFGRQKDNPEERL